MASFAVFRASLIPANISFGFSEVMTSPASSPASRTEVSASSIFTFASSRSNDALSRLRPFSSSFSILDPILSESFERRSRAASNRSSVLSAKARTLFAASSASFCFISSRFSAAFCLASSALFKASSLFSRKSSTLSKVLEAIERALSSTAFSFLSPLFAFRILALIAPVAFRVSFSLSSSVASSLSSSASSLSSPFLFLNDSILSLSRTCFGAVRILFMGLIILVFMGSATLSVFAFVVSAASASLSSCAFATPERPAPKAREAKHKEATPSFQYYIVLNLPIKKLLIYAEIIQQNRGLWKSPCLYRLVLGVILSISPYRDGCFPQRPSPLPLGPQIQ